MYCVMRTSVPSVYRRYDIHMCTASHQMACIDHKYDKAYMYLTSINFPLGCSDAGPVQLYTFIYYTSNLYNHTVAHGRQISKYDALSRVLLASN